MAPMIAYVVDVDHLEDGPLTLDLDLRPAVIFLTLSANVTELTLDRGSDGQLVILIVAQDGAGGFTWTPAPSIYLAGGAPAQPGSRDLYTLVYDGEAWNETGRSLGLAPAPESPTI